jgi:putative membrane protein insertion efficiency factor
MSLLRRIAILPIRLYQRVISPLTPPSCRYVPNCSEYGAQAILGHGVIKGTLLTAWRILRCHPFTPGGLDPVPHPGRWKSDERVPARDDESRGSGSGA